MLLRNRQADDLIIIFEANTGKRLTTLSDHAARITDLRFSPSGNLLLSSSLDGTIRLWGIPED